DTTKPIKEITEVKLQMTLKSRPRNRQAYIRKTPESDGMKPTKKELVSQTRNALEQIAITLRSPPKLIADSIMPMKTDFSNDNTNNDETKSTTRNNDSKKKEELVSQTQNAIEQKSKTPRSPPKSTADSIMPMKTNSSNDTNNDETKNSYLKKKGKLLKKIQ
ncbi:24428_t:CDS:2, partial [Gigaspora margarita]